MCYAIGDELGVLVLDPILGWLFSDSVCPLPKQLLRLRCKPLEQDEQGREAQQDHLDDQVYKLHILRAMAKYTDQVSTI